MYSAEATACTYSIGQGGDVAQGGKDMATVKKVEGYTEEQISSAKRLIDVLMGVPEEKQPLFTAITTVYMDGMETGARIAREMEGAAV